MPLMMLPVVVATAVLLLVHAPPVLVLLSAVVRPAHTFIVPVIAAGNGLTVTAVVLIQPVASIYVIVAVPAVTPVTTPVDALIAAIVPLLLLHTPDGVASLSAVVRPAHTLVTPVIASGNGFTVTAVVAIHVVGNV